MKSNFLNSIGGRQSSTRLYGGITLIYAMIMSFLVLYWGKEMAESVILLATSSGTLFTMISCPVFVWMYGQKKTEVKQESNESTT